jgi:hypothetical protein
MAFSHPVERKFVWISPYGIDDQEYWIFGPDTRNECGDFYRQGRYHQPSNFSIERLLKRVNVVEEYDPDLRMDIGL